MGDKFHIVQLSFEEAYRRWPPRGQIEAVYRGFNQDAAIRAGWQTNVGGQCWNIQRPIHCTRGCPLCSGELRADEVGL